MSWPAGSLPPALQCLPFYSNIRISILCPLAIHFYSAHCLGRYVMIHDLRIVTPLQTYLPIPRSPSICPNFLSICIRFSHVERPLKSGTTRSGHGNNYLCSCLLLFFCLMFESIGIGFLTEVPPKVGLIEVDAGVPTYLPTYLW